MARPLAVFAIAFLAASSVCGAGPEGLATGGGDAASLPPGLDREPDPAPDSGNRVAVVFSPRECLRRDGGKGSYFTWNLYSPGRARGGSWASASAGGVVECPP